VLFSQSKCTLGNGYKASASWNRRQFIQNAGLLAAGSAVGWPLLSCNSAFHIPCLGTAPPPTPVPGMTYIRASEIGCALDCDLATGRSKNSGGAATDDGPRINAAMATASADHPITLVIDGSALISGLFLPAGGYWNIAGLGCGTGFFVKTGTNNDGIHNGPAVLPNNPRPPAPARGMNVSLSNFTLNGNQGNGFNGNSTSGTRQGSAVAWYFGINLMNLNNIVIEKVVVVRTSAYHIRLSNVGNVTVTGSVMQSGGLSTDGLHFDGPANDITISNCDFATGDDSIALNAPEGYGGDISRVRVTNCTFNSWSLMRLYTTIPGLGKFTIDTVSVQNCSATLAEAAFLIGLNAGSLPNSIASLKISDCYLTAPTVLALAENFGAIDLNNVTFTPSSSNVVWVPPKPTDVCAFVRPSPLYNDMPSIGSSLSFENCSIKSNGHPWLPVLMLDNDSRIGTVTFNGLAVQPAIRVPELLYIGSGSIGQLVLNSLNCENINSPGGFPNIESVSGAGVLATAWEFPDAVMANEVPYISASTGSPSIKINGVVEPYQQ
jgi:hypothetical protein